ncbi:M1 family metallopeptidase [Cytophaga sp. FL35]|uniref:M1 family metallopeptidase n=1 Tax=Cytophaga sp. FL35 TaxID=1904456 RepID=UPI001653A4F7|nr:M1 family metallopeptidase [Cytophaga sp. FL35]MBC6996879.1 M1 family metallopeptidase [Cytophaga sp. FL35]
MKLKLTLFSAFALIYLSHQAQEFTEQDTLRGSITPERAWWDLTFYDLYVDVDAEEKFISGSNIIRYKVLEPKQKLQVDLQPPMKIEKVTQNGKSLNVVSNGNAHFVELIEKQKKGAVNEIKVHFSGQPREAIRAPWDGGFSWKKDKNGKHFIATSNQGLGASVWWPNKDHMYDEVDSMNIRIKAPLGLIDVSNGQLIKVDENSNTYHWAVVNPINNYGVNINIGDYVHFEETFEGEKGDLQMDYYVLSYNLEKAKEHFKDAPKMMKAFEHWFGPYPFYEDGFKLVEVPYLGMEHQSSVTYGNQYKKGYLGRDLSGTGWGLKFDFIIIHEAGHEWFANNITYKDIADMWVHEGFTAYSENIFIDYYHGKEAAADYVIGTRANIQNDKPIIGPYGVNQRGSGDMYYKGANMLHTIRYLIDDDEKWRQILRGLNKEFYHKTVTTEEIENYLTEHSGLDLSKVFDQYLRTTKIPILEYQITNNGFRYRYTNVVDGFEMPLKINAGDKELEVKPTDQWAEIKVNNGKISSFKVDRNYYVESKEWK